MSKTAGRVFAFFKSIRLTFALLVWLAVVAAVSTFIPRSLLRSFHFFRSPVFLVPAGLFFLNLLACTVFRFTRELRKKGRRNFGPDILHGGLLFFMIAALLSALNRWEGLVTLQAGGQSLLPDGSIVALDRLEYAPLTETTAQLWASYITVTRDNRTLAGAYPLRVNHPLKLEKYSLYQYAWGYKDNEAYTVIQAVQDPAYTLVLLSFAVCGLGICVILFHTFSKLRKST